MYVEKRTKSPIFTPPVYLTPPMNGLPLEFGIGVRGPECFYDGAIRWSKKFSDTFSRFDTLPAVTDSQPPSHPASHVAVAITLNAKASSLKKTSYSSAGSALVNRWSPTCIEIFANLRNCQEPDRIVWFGFFTFTCSVRFGSSSVLFPSLIAQLRRR